MAIKHSVWWAGDSNTAVKNEIDNVCSVWGAFLVVSRQPVGVSREGKIVPCWYVHCENGLKLINQQDIEISWDKCGRGFLSLYKSLKLPTHWSRIPLIRTINAKNIKMHMRATWLNQGLTNNQTNPDKSDI